MIFVTVGTHEQPFNRLIKEIDKLAKDNNIRDNFFIQTGFSDYHPQNCKWSKFLSYKEMNEYTKRARIIITHGGPASFIAPLELGKIPIVVPRQKKFNEHINDHQVEFVKQIDNKIGNIIPVYDIKELRNAIIDYNDLTKCLYGKIHSNNSEFNNRLSKIVDDLLGEKYGKHKK